MALKIEAAIAGIGTIGASRVSSASVTSMLNLALTGALADAGLGRSEVDGLFVHIGTPRGMDYDSIARLLALDISYAGQTWAHGRMMGTVLQHAAMAIESNLVSTALCVGAFKNSTFTRYGTTGFPDFYETLREGGGPHAEQPSAGLLAPLGGAAMATTRYLAKYGIDREKLGAVALAQRAWAALNEAAVMRTELRESDYTSSPYVVEPLRLLDCSVPIDTAVAILMTTAERASDLAQPPVRLLGYQGLQAGANEFVFGQPGLGVNQRDHFEYRPAGALEPVFQRADVMPEDVDALYCYDGVSPQVLWTLERFGFCEAGAGPESVADRRTAPGGRFPVNTAGGNLSEGHSNGWGHTVEIVRQLRGTAGARQIGAPRLAQWATTFGDSIIYGC